METLPTLTKKEQTFWQKTQRENTMRNEFAAIVEQDNGWYIAYSPEVPGANGQGRTKQEAMKSLSDAIALVLEDRRADGLRGAPENALKEIVIVECRENSLLKHLRQYECYLKRPRTCRSYRSLILDGRNEFHKCRSTASRTAGHFTPAGRPGLTELSASKRRHVCRNNRSR